MVYIWIAISVVFIISVSAYYNKPPYFLDTDLINRLNKIQEITNKLATDTSPRRFNVGEIVYAHHQQGFSLYKDKCVVISLLDYGIDGWEYRLYSIIFEKYITVNEGVMEELEDKHKNK